MKSRSIIFTEAYKAELLETNEREVGPDDVLVRMIVSSISSGTERANLIGDPNINILDNNPVAKFPRTVGYSSAGIIEKIGNNVTDVKIGDRVAMTGSKHTQFMVIHKDNVHKIQSEDISFNEAALWYIACFPAAAVRKCRLEFGESAIVMGMGVLGLIAVKILSSAGAAPIVAVDPDPKKRELALKIGADFAFDPFDSDFIQNVKDATCGGVNVAIEVTGNGKALDQVLDCMKRFGRVALLGCTRNSDFTIDYYRKVHGPGITLIGAHTAARPSNESFSGWWCVKDEVKGIQNLTKCGRLKLSDLVEEIHSPTKAYDIYTRLANEKSFPVVQFDWSDLE